MSHGRYKLRDYTFGLLSLKLREKTGLTQMEVASLLGVTDKSIRNWESGVGYPNEINLKKLVDIYLHYGAFVSGQEQEEAREFWDQANQHNRHTLYRRASFDEAWFAVLLAQQPPPVLPGARAEQNTAWPHVASRLSNVDWGEAVDVSSFYGRENELAELEQWILTDRCRLVALLGIGGIGKTILSVKLSQQVAPHFEYIVWRTVRNAPPIEEVLADCIQVISEQKYTNLPTSVEHSITLLIDLLRKHRCLLVLDNVETLLQGKTLEGHYREGFEGYAALIRRISETLHQSCLLLTSREMIKELAQLVGVHASVRALRVPGLDKEASQAMLKESGLFGTQEAWTTLVRHYSGNPLALKIVTEAVRELFGGDIAAFLHEGQITFKGILLLLTQQFERLSMLEREMLYWLAIECDPVSLENLRADLIQPIAKGEIVEALGSLRRRCLLERGERGAVFTLQPVVQEYVIERLVAQVCEEIMKCSPDFFVRYALMKGQSKEYIRNSQVHLIIQPVLNKMLRHLKSPQSVEASFMQMIEMLKERPYAEQGYGGGNIVNLLVRLKGNVSGLDFSHLAIWQAYLQGIEARDVNFAGSDLAGSVFMENFNSITSVALSHDGKYLAAGGFDGNIRVWRLTDSKLVSTLRGHSSLVWSIAISRDGTLLASGGYDRSVRLWDVSGISNGEENEGKCIKELQGHTSWIRSVAFSYDARMLATGDDGGMIHVWDVEDGTCFKTLQGHIGTKSVKFSPDGLLASGGDDGEVRLWETVNYQCIMRIPAHSGWVWSIAFSLDGGIFATGGENGDINLWETASGRCLKTLQGHMGYTTSVVFGPDGLLASGGHDNLVKLWEVSSGRCLRTLQGHAHWIWSIDFNSDGILASGSHDGLVKLWDVGRNGESVHCVRTLYGCTRVICSVAFSPDGTTLVSGSDNGTICVWDIESGTHIKTLQGHIGRIWTIACSPDGTTFASGGDDYTKIWERRGKGEEDRCLWTLRDHPTPIWSVAFSPDGSILATSGIDGMIKLWEVKSGKCLRTLQGGSSVAKGWIWSMAFNSDGSILASGRADGEIKLWDIAGGCCYRTIQDGNSPIGALAFSTDDKTVAGCNDEEIINVWEVSSGQCLRSLEGRGHANWVQSMAFCKGASLLAAGDDGQVIKVWEMDGEKRNDVGVPARIMRSHVGRVWSVAFSPDKSMLASGSDSGNILLWDVQTGSYLKTLQIDGPYERMNIRNVFGLTEAQKTSLKELGALER